MRIYFIHHQLCRGYFTANALKAIELEGLELDKKVKQIIELHDYEVDGLKAINPFGFIELKRVTGNVLYEGRLALVRTRLGIQSVVKVY